MMEERITQLETSVKEMRLNICQIQMDVVEYKTRAEERQLAWMHSLEEIDKRFEALRGTICTGNWVVIATLVTAMLVHIFIK